MTPIGALATVLRDALDRGDAAQATRMNELLDDIWTLDHSTPAAPAAALASQPEVRNGTHHGS